MLVHVGIRPYTVWATRVLRTEQAEILCGVPLGLSPHRRDCQTKNMDHPYPPAPPPPPPTCRLNLSSGLALAL